MDEKPAKETEQEQLEAKKKNQESSVTKTEERDSMEKEKGVDPQR